MAKMQKNPKRMLNPRSGFPRGRLIWARLFEAEAMEEGNDPSFSCAILYKANQNIKAIRAAIQAAVDDMPEWKGDLPRKALVCLIDDDDEIAELAEKYEYVEPGDAILKMRRYEKYGPPQLWDQQVEPIQSPTEMYSGCHVVADVEFYPWARKSSAGVSCRLNGLQKVRDDEPLSGAGLNTAESFSKVDVEDDDNDKPSGRKVRARRRNADDELI